MRDDGVTAGLPRFYSVAQVAGMFGVSTVTLYRAMRNGEFPAVRVRGRLVVPAKVIDAIIEAAVAGRSVVDVAAWSSRQVTL